MSWYDKTRCGRGVEVPLESLAPVDAGQVQVRSRYGTVWVRGIGTASADGDGKMPVAVPQTMRLRLRQIQGIGMLVSGIGIGWSSR